MFSTLNTILKNLDYVECQHIKFDQKEYFVKQNTNTSKKHTYIFVTCILSAFGGAVLAGILIYKYLLLKIPVIANSHNNIISITICMLPIMGMAFILLSPFFIYVTRTEHKILPFNNIKLSDICSPSELKAIRKTQYRTSKVTVMINILWLISATTINMIFIGLVVAHIIPPHRFYAFISSLWFLCTMYISAFIILAGTNKPPLETSSVENENLDTSSVENENLEIFSVENENQQT